MNILVRNGTNDRLLIVRITILCFCKQIIKFKTIMEPDLLASRIHRNSVYTSLVVVHRITEYIRSLSST